MNAKEIVDFTLRLDLPPMGALTEAALFHDLSVETHLPENIDWDAELKQIIDQRLASVALRLIDNLNIPAPLSAKKSLQRAVFEWTQISYLAALMAVQDLRLLDEANIKFVVVKGPGIAARSARPPAERPYSDVDVLVPESSFEDALLLLCAAGYSEEVKNLLPWPSSNRYCREAVNVRNARGGSLDVHRRIPPWFWSSHIRFEDIYERASEITISKGRKLLCASSADNTIVSALHIVSDKSNPGATLMAWRDFLLQASVSDVNEVVKLARSAQLCGWLNWVIDALPNEVQPKELRLALAHEDLRIPGRFRLAALTSRSPMAHRLISPAFRLPLPNAAVYLAGMAWPSSEFLTTKAIERPFRRIAWWKGGLAELKGNGPR